MKKILYFAIFLLIFTINYADTNSIYIENKIMIGNELVFNSPNYGREYKWTIKERPFFSESFIDSKDNNAYFIPDKAGAYILELFVDGNSYGEKSFFVNKNTRKTEKELINTLEDYYRKENLYMLFYNIQLLEENYSSSYYIRNIYDKVIDLANRMNSVEIEKEYIDKILKRYKMTVKEEIFYLLKLYKIYEKNNNIDKMEEVYLDIISKDNSYIKMDAQKYINVNYNKYFPVLLNYYNNTFDKEAGEILGDYYFNNKDYCNAENYYKISNKFKLVKVYLKTKNQEKVEELMQNLETSEKISIQKYIIESRAEERDLNYYNTAEENFKNYKFEIAEIYYNKILKESINNELKIKVMYKLAKLYFSEKKYNLSKKYFEDFIEKNTNKGLEIDSLYHIGVILFDTNQVLESEVYFDNIIDNYPYTLWETKSRIYKIKIKNKKEI